MTSDTQPGDTANPRNIEAQAYDLWAYVLLNRPRFTLATAREVAKRLNIGPDTDVKTLALALRKALRPHGVALKHHAGLEAAARLLGHANFQSARRNDPPKPRLRFSHFTAAFGLSEAHYDAVHWRGLIERVRTVVGAVVRDSGVRHFRVEITAHAVTFWFKYAQTPGDKPVDSPMGTITPVNDTVDWLTGAPTLVEAVRRELEEAGGAFLDGAAVMSLCSNEVRSFAGIAPPQPKDAANAELVLMREDGFPESGFEIARGDELTCFSELDLACESEAVSLSEEDGAWLAGSGRYTWQLEVLRPHEYVPGRYVRVLDQDAMRRLFHRYRLAQRIFAGKLTQHETKSFDHFRGVPDTVRVNQHAVLHALKDAGHTWESYSTSIGSDQPLQAKLPIGFVYQLLEALKVARPNDLFAYPNRKELTLLTSDAELRTLLPRVQTTRFRLAEGIPDETANAVRAAVREFNEGLSVWMFMRGSGEQSNVRLPYLTHADTATELFGALMRLDLRVYVGVTLHLFPTAGLPEAAKMPPVWPFALGYALFLHVEPEDTRTAKAA